MAVLKVKNDKGEWGYGEWIGIPFFSVPSETVIDMANIPEVEVLEATNGSPIAVKYQGEIYVKVEE